MQRSIKIVLCVAFAAVATPAFSLLGTLGSGTLSLASNSYDGGSANGLARACEHRDARACKQLGWLYQKGDTVPQDMRIAAEFYKKSCDLGGDGCNDIGTFYEHGTGVTQDYSQAGEFYKRGCELNNAIACSNLGVLYRNGLGVVRDPVKEAAAYQKGCDLGDSVGCRNLGIVFEEGKSVPQDYQEALHLYEKACNLGDGGGCANAGNFFIRGNGVRIQFTKADEFYEKGCRLNDGTACFNLALSFQYPINFPKADLATAAFLYGKACELGMIQACALVTPQAVEAEIARTRGIPPPR